MDREPGRKGLSLKEREGSESGPLVPGAPSKACWVDNLAPEDSSRIQAPAGAGVGRGRPGQR